MRKNSLLRILPLIIVAAGITLVLASSVAVHAEGETATGNVYDKLGKAIGAALAVGLAGLGAGYAIAVAGGSGLSAMAEKPELGSQVLLIAALGEGVAIYGLLVAILVIFAL